MDPVSMSILFGSLGSAALGGIFSMSGAQSQAKYNREMMNLQREENQKTRQWNLDLARLQNHWNIQQYNRERADSLADYNLQRANSLIDYNTQRADALADWNRENTYNSPVAQMQRYNDAGLNPNMIYGQSNTAGSLSSPSIAGSSMSSPSIAGSLTSGSPESALNVLNFMSKSKGAALAEAMSTTARQIGETFMQYPLYKEQVRKARAEAQIAENNANDSNYDTSIKEFVRRLNFSPSSLESLLNYGAGNDPWAEDGSLYNNPDVRKYLMDYQNKYNDWKFMNDTYEALVDKTLAESRKTDDEAKIVRDTIKSTIKAINDKNAGEIDWQLLESKGISPEVVAILKFFKDVFD